MENLKLVKISKNYCEYLKKFESKVSDNQGKKSTRPFIGILFDINECNYFAPLSSPKPKHLKMRNHIDFYKIEKGKLGVINFNNMIPVKEEVITYIDLKKDCKDIKSKKYYKLLQEQFFYISRNNKIIRKKSKNLYEKYINNTLNKNVAKRCCNFKLLEEKCFSYSIKKDI